MIKTFILFLIVINANISFGKTSKFYALPTAIHQNSSKTKFAQMTIPCNSKYIGLIAQAAGKNSIRLGGLVEEKYIKCAGLDRIIRIPIPEAITRSYALLGSVKTYTGSGIIKFAKIAEIRETPHRNSNRSNISLVYYSNCGKPLGTLFNTQNGTLNLGYLEYVKKSDKEACVSTQKLAQIQNIARPNSIKIFQWETKNLYGASSLKFSKIKKGSIHYDGKSLSFKYRRKCNEAPIGIVARENKSRVFQLGILVAHYYNQRCHIKSKKSSWTYYKTDSLKIPTDITLARITDKKTHQIEISEPISYTIKRRGIKKGLELTSYGGCKKELGTVLLAADRHMISWQRIGILKLSTSTPCKKPIKKVSLALPFFVKKASQTLRPFHFGGV